VKIAFLGHRVQDLGGFDGNQLQDEIKQIISDKIKESGVSAVLTSGSVGIEMWAADAAIDAKVPYHLYVPFANPESKWPASTKKKYKLIANKASKTVVLDNGEYDAKKLATKDLAILEEADIIYSFYKDHPRIFEKFSKKIVDSFPNGGSDGYFIPF